METNETFDPFSFNYEEVETGPSYTNAKPGVYALKVESVEVELNEEWGSYVATIRQSFLNPESVEKISTGVLGNVFDRITLNSPAGAKKFRGFVESMGGDFATVGQAIRARAGEDFATVAAEILQQFIGASGNVKLLYDTDYLDRKTQTRIALKNPRNSVQYYVTNKTSNKTA